MHYRMRGSCHSVGELFTGWHNNEDMPPQISPVTQASYSRQSASFSADLVLLRNNSIVLT